VAALIAGLTFVAPKTVALISWLAFVTLLTGSN
jgi:hypothetical protein